MAHSLVQLELWEVGKDINTAHHIGSTFFTLGRDRAHADIRSGARDTLKHSAEEYEFPSGCHVVSDNR